jgi:DNA-directed RNA polymerase beta subunit
MAREKKNDQVKVNFNSNNAFLKEQLQELEEKYYGKNDIFGMTGLTRIGYISGNRGIMTTGHLKQAMTPINPEFPKVFTENENMVGKNSTGIKKARRNWRVIDKVYKFEEGNHLYTLIVKDEETGYYDVIQKQLVEDLTEKFGFRYNTEDLDKIQVGDLIPKDSVLYKSTSYDEFNNYRFGVNATFCYTSDVRTTEDAILVSESFADKFRCVEVETIKVSVNDNDILLNLYGDENNYKCFPDIGEYINDAIICATRRIRNEQIFYDFKETNLRKINFSDDVLCIEHGYGGKIIDIKVYSNKSLEEMELNEYHAQVNKYFVNEQRYYTELIKATEDIVLENKEHSRNFNYVYKKSKDITDDNVKWCEQQGKKPYNNMIIEFTVEREVPLKKGSKITGLFGNKGVISEIVPDDKMPVLSNGKVVDVLFNCLGVINRLNSFQLFEQSINFIMNRTIDRIKTLETNDQRAALVFTMIKHFNTRQATEMGGMYSKLSVEGKEAFIQDIYDKGIYVHIPPFWHERPLFDVINEIYDTYEWLTPYKAYIKKNGRYRPIMNDLIVGEMYIIRLKQTASKGLSTRSVGGVNLIGVPVKDAQAKENKILYSKTPCRLGIDEVLNLLIGMDPYDLAKMNMSYRSSIEGTHDLPVQLLKQGMIESLRDDDKVINRNVEVFNAYLKTMGYKLQEAENIQELIFDSIDNDLHERELPTGEKVLVTDETYINLLLEYKVDKYFEEEIFIGPIEEYEELRKELKEKYRKEYEEAILNK